MLSKALQPALSGALLSVTELAGSIRVGALTPPHQPHQPHQPQLPHRPQLPHLHRQRVKLSLAISHVCTPQLAQPR